MEKSKLTEAQIAVILRQSKEDSAIGDILRKAGISAATYGDLIPSEIERLHQLRDENRKLKKIIAALSQYREMIQGKRRKI